MNKSTFESLPNELFLIIFSYLSSFDLCQAFLYINNARIQCLLTLIPHSLNVNLMHYGQLHLWLNSNDNHRNRFNSLIDTVVFNDSYASWKLFIYWGNTFKENYQLNVLFPSIKHLVVFNAGYCSYYVIQPILIPLLFTNNTLQYLHLIFQEPTYRYSETLSELVRHRISVPTMILEVEQGMLSNMFFEIKQSTVLLYLEPSCRIVFPLRNFRLIPSCIKRSSLIS
jgi:hypothetical protein